MNRGELIDAVVTQGGFDTSTASTSRDVVASWLQNRLNVLVSKSLWLKTQVELGPAVAGQHEYVIPDSVLDVSRLFVAGSEYMRVGVQDMFALRGATNTYLSSDAYGAYAPGYDPTGVAVVDVFPTPTEDGALITALCATVAPVMTEDTDTPAVPADFHEDLVNGAIGLGMRRVYERHDEADRFDAMFDSPGGEGAVQRLKRRANSRVGSGPMRFRIVS